MIAALRPLLAGLSALVLLSGCSSLPTASPTVGQVLKPVDREQVEVIDIRPETPSGATASRLPLPPWAIGNAPPEAEGIVPGDVLSITIYEVGYSLFGGPATVSEGSGGARSSGHRFPDILVPETGVITLPYAGAIRVTGLAPDRVARAIESRLRGKSQYAQAVVAAANGPQRSVVLSGDIKRPGRVALTAARERLLDAIAIAAGPDPRPADTLVRVTRDGLTSTARLDEIAEGSAANIILAPGDRVELARDVRSLTVLGAAKTVSQIAFDSANLTLSEALARSGGLIDEKSDATGVFIFRYELREKDGVTVEKPVIYRLNLLDPTSYFAAQRFQMREKDVMLVANARSTQINKLIQLVGSLTSPIFTVDLLTR